MLRFATRRVLTSLLVMWAVYSVTFVVLKITPGSPFADRSLRPLPPSVEEQIAQRYGLDESALTQYFRNLWGVVRGDFGPSYQSQGREVWDLIGPTIATTAALVLAALAVGIAVGVPAGLYAARNREGRVDRFIVAVSGLALSVPVFALTAVLLVVLGVNLDLVPTSGFDGLFTRSAIVPVIALSLDPAAVVARFTRAAIMEVQLHDHLKTAKAAGLSSRSILVRHTLMAALPSVLTIVALEVSVLIGAAAAVEVVANIDGAGRALINALVSRDFPTIQALTLVAAFAIVMANLLADLAVAAIDPRKRGG